MSLHVTTDFCAANKYDKLKAGAKIRYAHLLTVIPNISIHLGYDCVVAWRRSLSEYVGFRQLIFDLLGVTVVDI